VIDLLNLPGIQPVDLRTGRQQTHHRCRGHRCDVPSCPDCGKPCTGTASEKQYLADTPMQMQPVRLEIYRAPLPLRRMRKDVLMPELTFLDDERVELPSG
jgi:transposase